MFSLTPDSSADRGSWDDKLGKPDFSVGFSVLSSASFSMFDDQSLPQPQLVTSSAQNFISWMIWGVTAEDSAAFFSHSTELARVLIRYGQYNAVEVCFSLQFHPKNSMSWHGNLLTAIEVKCYVKLWVRLIFAVLMFA